MFQSNSEQNLWVNFLSYYKNRKKLAKVEKIYVPHFLISEKINFFLPELINNFNLFKKKAILNWKTDKVFFYDIQSKSNFCNCEIQANSFFIHLKKKVNLRLLSLVCKFIRFLTYSILLKKVKTNSYKRVNKDSNELVKFCCLNITLIVNKLLKKFSNSKILTKLEKTGAIKIFKQRLKKVNYIKSQIKNFQNYNKKLKYFSQFSKFIYLQ
jgi:hypothetical protein